MCESNRLVPWKYSDYAARPIFGLVQGQPTCANFAKPYGQPLQRCGYCGTHHQQRDLSEVKNKLSRDMET